MKLIGKDNGHMSDLKFLYSAVDGKRAVRTVLTK